MRYDMSEHSLSELLTGRGGTIVSTGEERRARHLAERRESILEAAAHVFARKGFEKATTREIAQEADVSEGTIYNYFTSKRELLTALADMVQSHFAAVVPVPIGRGDDRANITKAVERVLEVIAEQAVVIRGLLTALWEDQGYDAQTFLIPGMSDLVSRVVAYLQGRMAAGSIRSCDVQVVARMIVGMIVYLAMPYVRGTEPVPSGAERRQQAELLVSILMDGLRA
ncbi:MAG: TetR/AcrR family transcriptional regulator [Chloroflexi bacterium]|nr:TetR/AcrR family transcriptional regulator [Chloroflexota bacterium]